jgi:putative endonuclease
MANRTNKVLYTGVTSDLTKRAYEHKHHLVKGFTDKYNLEKLAYYELFSGMIEAIEREKKIKGWTRAKKIALIEKVNPEWKDLYESIF